MYWRSFTSIRKSSAAFGRKKSDNVDGNICDVLYTYGAVVIRSRLPVRAAFVLSASDRQIIKPVPWRRITSWLISCHAQRDRIVSVDKIKNNWLQVWTRRSQHLQACKNPRRNCILCLVTLTFWPFDPKWVSMTHRGTLYVKFGYLRRFLDILPKKTDRQTDRQTNAGEDPTSATSIDVGN